jgi:hypothetical protein
MIVRLSSLISYSDSSTMSDSLAELLYRQNYGIELVTKIASTHSCTAMLLHLIELLFEVQKKYLGTKIYRCTHKSRCHAVSDAVFPLIRFLFIS